MPSSQRSTSQRGYGADHEAKRDQWAPKVKTGRVRCHAKICLKPSRTIAPDDDWDLGHTEDRTDWTGPEHRACNRADGGRRSGAKSAAPRRWTL